MAVVAAVDVVQVVAVEADGRAVCDTAPVRAAKGPPEADAAVWAVPVAAQLDGPPDGLVGQREAFVDLPWGPQRELRWAVLAGPVVRVVGGPGWPVVVVGPPGVLNAV